MKLKTVAIIAPLAGTLFCGAAWGQQTLGSPSPANPTAKSSQKTP
ncbi:MAG: hypothetical protein ACLQVG_09290 [Terriglobia bacterium]